MLFMAEKGGAPGSQGGPRSFIASDRASCQPTRDQPSRPILIGTEVIARRAGQVSEMEGPALVFDYSLQHPFNSHQVSVWVSVRRCTAVPLRLQPSLNPHVSASRDARERAKAELESERLARVRGFKSLRFRQVTVMITDLRRCRTAG